MKEVPEGDTKNTAGVSALIHTVFGRGGLRATRSTFSYLLVVVLGGVAATVNSKEVEGGERPSEIVAALLLLILSSYLPVFTTLPLARSHIAKNS